MRSIKFQLVVLFLIGFGHTVNAQKGSLYPKFPESFEGQEIKSDGYANSVSQLNTGKWAFVGARIDSFVNDHPSSGKNAARLVGNNTKPAYVQMNFDLNNGASKVIYWYSSYGAKADKPCQLQLEYSTDGGKEWNPAGELIEVKSKIKQAATVELDVKGNVRFRIHKLALGSPKEDPSIANGRLSIDDFSVYKN